MMSCRGMGAVNPDKLPGAALKKGGKVEPKVNEAGKKQGKQFVTQPKKTAAYRK